MLNIKNNVKKFYNEAGAYFSKSRQKTYGSGNATWIETRPYLNKIEAGNKVLDLGCGNGRLLTGINKDIHYVGLDFSETLINEAQKLHPSQEFKVADITKKEAWENLKTFDAIFSVATLHHLPNKRDQLFVLNQINKHLKPGGFAYLTFWNMLNKKFWPNHLKSLGLKFRNIRWVKIPFKNKWDRFLFTFTKSYLKKLVNKTGLKISKLYYVDNKGKETNFLNGRNLVVVLERKPA